MSSDQVCTAKVHLVCMWDAWASTQGEKCIKHTTKDQNMINMHNHGNPQSLVLIGVQNSEKMPFGHFIRHRVHTLHMFVKQCMNIWKFFLNTYYFFHKAPTSKANDHLNKAQSKRLTKNKFSNSYLRKFQLWT